MGLLSRKSKAPGSEAAPESPLGRPTAPEEQVVDPTLAETAAAESTPPDEAPPTESKADRWLSPERGQAGRNSTGDGHYASQKASHDDLQHKTFIRWWNAELPKGDGVTMLEDLPSGIADGVAAVKLVEALGGKPLKGWKPAPRNLAEKIENQNIFMARLKELKIPLVGIGPEDLADGRKLTLVLGLTWSMISHFGGITEQSTSELLDWVKVNAGKVGVSVSGGYVDSMKDGQALCGLMSNFDPLCIDKKAIASADAATAIETAFKAAESYGAPRLLDTNDLATGKVDSRSLSTYLVMLQSALIEADKNRNKGVLKETEALAAKAAEEAAWHSAEAQRIKDLTAKVSKMDPGRPEAVDEADAMWKELDKFAASDLKEHEKARAELTKTKDSLVKRMAAIEEADNFVHGPRRRARLTKRPSPEEAEVVPQTSDEVEHVLDEIDPTVVALTKADEEYRAALDNILTTRRTDAMLVEVESKVDELSKFWSEWAKKLRGGMPAAGAALADTQTAADLLELYSKEAAAEIEATVATQKKLEEVARRRKKEEREAPAEWSVMAEKLVPAKGEAEAAAVDFRRALADAVAKQVTELNKLTSSWTRLASALETQLPADSELASPLPPVPWFMKCLPMK